jgi:hypothetical protein
MQHIEVRQEQDRRLPDGFRPKDKDEPMDASIQALDGKVVNIRVVPLFEAHKFAF